MKKDILIVLGSIFFGVGLLKLCFGASPEKIYKETNPKVVQLHIIYKKGGGICSGSFITESGLVLTCAHCFDASPAKVFVLLSDGRVIKGTFIRKDVRSDLALVYTEQYNTPYFKLGRHTAIGQQVFAFGSPLGIPYNMSVGYIENYAYITPWKTIVFNSAFVSPGNSGGPLVNTRGQLVGVNEAMLMVNFFMPAQGMFIAVSEPTIETFLNGN